MSPLYYLLRIFPYAKNFNPKESLLIFGDPRSGSTWLAEMLHAINKSCFIDEPLHLGKNNQLSEIPFYWRQSIPDIEKWDDAYDFFNNLFTGTNYSPSCLTENTILQFLRSNRGLYKIINGKLLLRWMLRNFVFQYKPIYLIRHPLGMIASLRKHPAWNYSFVPFEIPDGKYTEVYDQHLNFLKGLKSNAEQMLAFWCLANREFLNDPSFYSDKTIVVYYEELLLKPKETFEKIHATWGISIPKFKYSKLRKPSSSSLSKGPILPSMQLDKWKKELSHEDLVRYLYILDYFGIQNYNGKKI